MTPFQCLVATHKGWHFEYSRPITRAMMASPLLCRIPTLTPLIIITPTRMSLSASAAHSPLPPRAAFLLPPRVTYSARVSLDARSVMGQSTPLVAACALAHTSLVAVDAAHAHAHVYCLPQVGGVCPAKAQYSLQRAWQVRNACASRCPRLAILQVCDRSATASHGSVQRSVLFVWPS